MFCCHETDMDSEAEAFEEQTPSPLSAPRLLRASVRTTASSTLNEHILALYNRTSTAEIATSEFQSIFMEWSNTKKIATRITEGPMARKSFEKIAILAAYKHALGLGNNSDVSAYRDALIDAMTEYFDRFGGELGWNALAEATNSQSWCSMWKL
ncbi:hypothetical protein BDU57DRAFT_514950 [Ampelomyces quisqualis]|uniref:Uncharacterized protein n=1 Tax=Ampelomyces quisqualis TaxID=50730 RepID=A0A6A5QWM0_AMPQU|nr:hypothetical protein BDU57DRAFT_514950 [Ampelomyces quisqualis]